MADDYSINAKITADNSGFKKSVEEASKSIGNFGKTLSTFKTAVAGAFVVKGIHEFTKAMNECAKLYVVQAKAEKTLEVASKNNPYLNGDSVKALKSYASELQNISEIGDEQLLPMMAQLAAAGRNQNEIQNIMKAAVDISASGMMSLESAVKSLSGSYAGQIGQLGKLLPQLKNLTTEELENGKAVEIAGKAYEGIAQSTANSSKQLQNSIGDLKEQLGYGWETAFSPMRKGLKDIIDRWTEALKKANDAKKAMTNLDTVVTSGGSAGNVKDAKGTQKDINDRLQKEYRELSRLAELSAKKLKERTKAEKAEYADLIIAYDSYLAKYKLMADTEVEAVRMAQEDKKKEWQKGLNDFQLIIAKEKELEEEQARIDAENATQEKINARKALTDAYDETIAKAREEIEIHRQMGEEITREEESAKMLEVMKQAYVKMIQESNGELKIEKTRLNDIIKLEEELKKALKETTNAAEDLGNATKDTEEEAQRNLNDFLDAWETFKAECFEEAGSWSDFFLDAFHTFQNGGMQAIETIGQSLVEGEDAWQNMGAVALETIAQILEALAKELAALTVVNATQYNYGQAAAAAAGATAALVGAGALKGMASTMKKVSDDTKKVVLDLNQFAELLKKIQSEGSTGGTSKLAQTFEEVEDAIKIANENLAKYKKLKDEAESYYTYSYFKNGKASWTVDGVKTQRALDAYTKSLALYNVAVKEVDDALKAWDKTLWETENNLNETNVSLESEISTLKRLYSEYSAVSSAEIYGSILSSVNKKLADYTNIGSSIGEMIMNGVVNGASQSDFVDDMKDYIRKSMLTLAIYTDEFTKSLSESTENLLRGLATGDNSLIETSKNAIETLYVSALETSKVAEKSIDSIFGSINMKTTSAMKSVENILNNIKENGFTDISSTLKQSSDLNKQISDVYNQMKSAEQNYYNESARLTNTRKNQLQDQINSLIEERNKVNAELAEQQKQYDAYYAWGFYTSNIDWWVMAESAIKPEIDSLTESSNNLSEQINSLNNELSTTYVISQSALDTWNDTQAKYNDTLNAVNNALKDLSENLKAQNKELDNQITLYRELFKSSNTYYKSSVLETQLNAIKNQFYAFFEDLNNMGLNVGENLVNAIADGMSQADFLTSMKDYIRKAIIQTVVYTETLQHEIAQIGATISKGIAEGFTDTGLHEIKRDLSYIFYMAQNSISKIDTVLDNVFSGYATGTQNATRGLHLVGEAGPELVRFRGGEQVLNVNNTQKALNGAGTTINQNVTFNNLNDTSAFAMMQQFKRYNREMAINGIF